MKVELGELNVQEKELQWTEKQMLLDHEQFLKEKLLRKRTKIKSVEAEIIN